MAAKKFHISTPEQMAVLDGFAVEQPNSLDKIRRIWKAAIQKKASTRWDNAFYVYFSGDNKRQSSVYRISVNGAHLPVCALRYNLAHRYCCENLDSFNE